MNKKIPKGVYIFGLGIVLTSIANLITVFTSYHYYWTVYHQWPYPLFIARYYFSILQRVAGLVTAYGLLNLKEYGRKLGFVIGCFTISTVYIKHWYPAYLNQAHILDRTWGPILHAHGLSGVSFAQMAIPAMFINCLLDVSFWLVFIYYFTRPPIEKLYKPEG